MVTHGQGIRERSLPNHDVARFGENVGHPPTRPLFAGQLEAGKADLKECGKGVRAAGNLVWVVPVVSWAGALPETSFPKTENE
jgi:hypothetical protein